MTVNSGESHNGALTLGRIPYLVPLLDNGLIDSPLFMKVSDPRVNDERSERRPSRFRYNLIPLSLLMEDKNLGGFQPLIKGRADEVKKTYNHNAIFSHAL